MRCLESHAFPGFDKVVFQFQNAMAGSQPGLQLVHVKWLREVIVGAGLQTRHDVPLRFLRRQQDQVSVSLLLAPPHFAAHLDTVLFRHDPVQQRQPRRIVLDELSDGLRTVFHCDHFVSGALQSSLEKCSRDGIIFGNKYPHGFTSASCASTSGSIPCSSLVNLSSNSLDSSGRLSWEAFSSAAAVSAAAPIERFLSMPFMVWAVRESPS